MLIWLLFVTNLPHVEALDIAGHLKEGEKINWGGGGGGG